MNEACEYRVNAMGKDAKGGIDPDIDSDRFLACEGAIGERG